MGQSTRDVISLHLGFSTLYSNYQETPRIPLDMTHEVVWCQHEICFSLGCQLMFFSFANNITHGQNKIFCSQYLRPINLSCRKCLRTLIIIVRTKCTLDGLLSRVIVGKFNHRKIIISNCNCGGRHEGNHVP